MNKTRVPFDLSGLTGRQEIFRLSGAAKSDAAVERWLNGEPAQLRALARYWFSHLRSCGADVLELMHDGGPTACVGDAAFAQVNAFRSHVNVGFFHGVTLDDPAGLLEGSGKRMRHVKLIPGEVIDENALKKLITAAYVDIKARLDDDMI
ncbi:MAG TPA: DUF1801 domain-containing protein [Steroidobacteraceae bacterium]|nr:DUF1801 domain-containing protein [Steroidobacteraceae bacterium]